MVAPAYGPAAARQREMHVVHVVMFDGDGVGT